MSSRRDARARRLVVMLTVAVFLLVHGAVALAKGPESVTIAGPGIEDPVELMDAVHWPISCDETCPPDPMVRLMEQTGLWYAAGDVPKAREQPLGDLGPRYKLTWTRGGFPDEPVEERTFYQFLYLDAEGGPSVHTPVQASLQDSGGHVFGWSKAPRGLVDSLRELRAPLPGSGKLPSGSDIAPNPFARLATAVAAVVMLMVWAARRRSPISINGSTGNSTYARSRSLDSAMSPGTKR